MVNLLQLIKGSVMKKITVLILISCAVVAFLSALTYADVITLKNGTNKKGTVIKQDKGFVYYKRDGKMFKVKQEYVQNIQEEIPDSETQQPIEPVVTPTPTKPPEPAPRLAQSDETGIGRGDFCVGLNYPGLGMRYFLGNRLSLEIKGQHEKDITVVGMRMNFYFKRQGAVLLFAGLEGDYLKFEGNVSEGSGYAGEVFLGGETFVAKGLSLQVDIGPAFIQVKDDDTKLKEDGVEIVTNIGINYYFGK